MMCNYISVKFIGAILSLIILSSCVPFTVKKVNYSDKVDGARYCVKRPSVVAALQVNMGSSKIIDLKSCNDSYQCKHALKNESFQLSKLAIQEAEEDGITQCLYHEDSSNDVDKSKSNLDIKLNIQQTLDTVDVYEVKHRYGFGLTNSALSVSTDDEGCLSNVSSTEADQTLEVISSVAALSISKVTNKIVENQKESDSLEIQTRGADTNTDDDSESKMDKSTDEFIIRQYGGKKLQCVYLDYKQENRKFQGYLKQHVEILRKYEIVNNTLNNNYKILGNVTTSEDQKQTLESIALLKAEKAALKEHAKVVGYRIPKNKYKFNLNGEFNGDSSTQSEPKWFTVKFCEQGKENQCKTGEQQ